MMGERASGASRATFAASLATSVSPSGDRSTRTATSAAALSAGVGRGGEDVGTSEVHEQIGVAAWPGHETTERAERLRQRADAHVRDLRECVDVRVWPEHRVGLVEYEHGVVLGTERHELLDIGEVAVHREHGIAHHDCARRRVGVLVQQLRQLVEMPVVVHGDVGTRETAAVDDRRVVELVGAHERAAPAERGKGADVRGEPGGEQHGRLFLLPRRELVLELGVHGTRARR